MMPLQLVGLFVVAVSAALLAREVAVMIWKDRLSLTRHIDLVAVPVTVKTPTTTARKQRLGTLVDEPARRVFGAAIRYSWGMQLGAIALLAIASGAAVGGWFFAYWMFGHSPWFASLASAAAFFVVPRAALIRQQRSAEQQFMELFPASIDMIVRMLRAGLPISAAVRSIQADTPRPLNLVFGSIADQVALGVPFEQALDLASERIGLPDFRFFAVALNLQSATGGNLAVTLETLADIIRKRRAMRLKATAITAEVRVSAYVLGAMPFITIGGLLLLQPEYVKPLFYDTRGKYILAAAAALLLLAFVTMRQMMRRVTAG